MKEIVIFFLSGKEYAMDISCMQGLENYTPISPMGGLGGKLLGVVTIRGQVLPVIDIKKTMVLPSVDVTPETKYVVIKTSHGEAAFVVDGVSEISQIDGADVQPCPPLISGENSSTGYVDFVARKGGKLILCINPDGLVTGEEWTQIDKLLKEAELQNGENDD